MLKKCNFYDDWAIHLIAECGQIGVTRALDDTSATNADARFHLPATCKLGLRRNARAPFIFMRT
jgi:hypothetical protein